jgi:hypothetical protein
LAAALRRALDPVPRHTDADTQTEGEQQMELINIYGRRCGAKALSAALAAGAVVTMAALTVAHSSDTGDAITSSGSSFPAATQTISSAPSAIATPFASPTHTATPCPPRATMPCT